MLVASVDKHEKVLDVHLSNHHDVHLKYLTICQLYLNKANLKKKFKKKVGLESFPTYAHMRAYVCMRASLRAHTHTQS